MKDNFKSLFPCGIDFETASETLMQNRCAVLGREQVDYIENATVNFSEMYEMLNLMTHLVKIKYGNLDKEVSDKIEESEGLLKRARGE